MIQYSMIMVLFLSVSYVIERYPAIVNYLLINNS